MITSTSEGKTLCLKYLRKGFKHLLYHSIVVFSKHLSRREYSTNSWNESEIFMLERASGEEPIVGWLSFRGGTPTRSVFNDKKWRGVDLNHRPVGYEPNALSTELPRHERN